MVIELPEQLEAALKVKADERGVSAVVYVQEILERDLGPEAEISAQVVPYKSCRGLWAKYGISLSAEDIDENRRDMFKNFGEDF